MADGASIPATMKAAQVVKHGAPLQMKDVPVPTPGDGEVLIKVECTGVCHTDVHVRNGDWAVKPPLPIIPGHEGVGRVVALGPGVNRLSVGDRVGVPWMNSACGSCFHCVAGWETVCPKIVCTGYSTPGTFAEYVKASAAFVGLVPDNLTNEQAAPICCAGVTVYKGLKVSKVEPGRWIAIVGAAGGLGHLAVQYGRAMGMKVIGVARGEDKGAFLKQLGCEAVVNGADPKYGDTIMSITGGGADGALIIAPRQEAINDAVMYVRSRGVVVPLGLPPGEFSANTTALIVKCVSIVGSVVGTRNDLQEALDFAACGKVKCVVEARKFTEVNSVMDEVEKGKLKGRIVVTMS